MEIKEINLQQTFSFALAMFILPIILNWFVKQGLNSYFVWIAGITVACLGIIIFFYAKGTKEVQGK